MYGRVVKMEKRFTGTPRVTGYLADDGRQLGFTVFGDTRDLFDILSALNDGDPYGVQAVD